MNLLTEKVQEICPQSEIAAYLDGELALREEQVLEEHFSVCETCRRELNEQKKLLRALDFALVEKNEHDVPKDFAKVVATRAESGVSGLRNRKERLTAFALIIVLSLLAFAVFGTETEKVASAVFTLTEKFFALILSLGRFVYEVSFGTVVILRSFSQQIFYNPTIILGLVFFVFTLFVLRMFVRISRF